MKATLDHAVARATGIKLKRLLSQRGLTLVAAQELSGVDPRTMRKIVRGDEGVQTRVYQKLASGLGVDVDAILANATPPVAFDKATNPAVATAIAANPELFEGWTDDEYAELFSHRGVGGEITVEGALKIAEGINERRELQRMVALVMETEQGPYVRGLIELAYKRAVEVEA